MTEWGATGDGSSSSNASGGGSNASGVDNGNRNRIGQQEEGDCRNPNGQGGDDGIGRRHRRGWRGGRLDQKRRRVPEERRHEITCREWGWGNVYWEVETRRDAKSHIGPHMEW